MSDWNEKSQALLRKWRSHMRILSEAHDTASGDTEKLYNGLAVPTIVIPLVMAPVEAMGHETPWMTYFIMLAFVTTGCLSAVNVFYGFKEKSLNHGNASNKLRDLINTIDMEFAKSKKDRSQATVLMQTIRLKVSQIGNQAPPVPCAPFLDTELNYGKVKSSSCPEAAIQMTLRSDYDEEEGGCDGCDTDDSSSSLTDDELRRTEEEIKRKSHKHRANPKDGLDTFEPIL